MFHIFLMPPAMCFITALSWVSHTAPFCKIITGDTNHQTGLTQNLCDSHYQCHNRNVIRCTFLTSLCFCLYLISHFIFSLSISPLVLLFWHRLGERLVCWWVTWIVSLHVAGLGYRSTVPDGRLVYCRRRDTASWLFQTTAVPKPGEGGMTVQMPRLGRGVRVRARALQHLKLPLRLSRGGIATPEGGWCLRGLALLRSSSAKALRLDRVTSKIKP